MLFCLESIEDFELAREVLELAREVLELARETLASKAFCARLEMRSFVETFVGFFVAPSLCFETCETTDKGRETPSLEERFELLETIAREAFVTRSEALLLEEPELGLEALSVKSRFAFRLILFWYALAARSARLDSLSVDPVFERLLALTEPRDSGREVLSCFDDAFDAGLDKLSLDDCLGVFFDLETDFLDVGRDTLSLIEALEEVAEEQDVALLSEPFWYFLDLTVARVDRKDLGGAGTRASELEDILPESESKDFVLESDFKGFVLVFNSTEMVTESDFEVLVTDSEFKVPESDSKDLVTNSDSGMLVRLSVEVISSVALDSDPTGWLESSAVATADETVSVPLERFESSLGLRSVDRDSNTTSTSV